MENPTCKVANDKLEYLVIDYTQVTNCSKNEEIKAELFQNLFSLSEQFDEWSSDEEGDDGGAIEKGKKELAFTFAFLLTSYHKKEA